MFSQRIYAEIVRVTQRALEELHSLNAIEQVTIGRGYARLAPHSGTNYDAKLRTSMERLLEFAKKEKQRQLTSELEALAEAMDRERAA